MTMCFRISAGTIAEFGSGFTIQGRARPASAGLQRPSGRVPDAIQNQADAIAEYSLGF
jgi:hypothetical protein